MFESEDYRKRKLEEAYGKGVEKARQTGALEDYMDAMATLVLPDSMGTEEYQSYRRGYHDYMSGKIKRQAPAPPRVEKPIALDASDKAWYELCDTSEFIQEEIIRYYKDQLVANGHHVAFVIGLSDFTEHICPTCGAQGQFKIHVLGRLNHPGTCGWEGYMKTGHYTRHQIAQIFHTGIRAGAAMKDEVDKKPDRTGNWIYAVFGFLFVAVFRAAAAVVLVPLHCIAALFQPRQTTGDIAIRLITLVTIVTGIVIGFYEIQQASKVPSSLASPPSQTSLLHQPCSPQPAPTALSLTSGPIWSVTSWQTNGNGSWRQQPVLTINGVHYPIETPQHAIYYLTQVKNAGGTGDIAEAISRFQAAEREFYDCPEYPIEQVFPATPLPSQEANDKRNDEQARVVDTTPVESVSPNDLTAAPTRPSREPDPEPIQQRVAFNTYTSQSFSISYPEDWEASARAHEVMIAPRGGTSGDDVIRGVLIRSFYVKGNHPGWGTLDEATRTLIEQLLMLPGNQWNGRWDPVTVGGFEGRSSIVTGPSLAGGRGTVWTLTAQTAAYSPLWVFAFVAPDAEYARYQEDFRVMRDSIHLILDHY